MQQHVFIACWQRGTTPARARSGLGPLYYRIASMDQFRLHFGLPPPHTNNRSKSWDWCINSTFKGDLNLRPVVKKTIILLLHRANVKVLKDALAHLGPYQTLMWVWYSDKNTVLLPFTIQI